MPVVPILIIADHSQDVYKFWKETKIAQNRIYDGVEFYFLYADQDQEDTVVAKGNDLFVRVEEGVKKGCIMKTYYGLQWVLMRHPDAEYVVRANLSVIFNIDVLLAKIGGIPQDRPVMSGLVFNGLGFGSFMLWNRKACDLLSSADALRMIEATGYQHNDDTTFSKLCHQFRVHFDESLRKYCKEHFFSYFHLPHLNGPWISSKKVVDDITNRTISDIWSVQHSSQLPQKVKELVDFPVFPPEDVANTMMNALHNLDCSGRSQFLIPNLNIMMQNLGALQSRFGELVYYVVKYIENQGIASMYVDRIVSLPQYDKETVRQWIDLIFYYSLIKRRIRKNVYDKIGLRIGHNGEKNDEKGLNTV